MSYESDHQPLGAGSASPLASTTAGQPVSRRDIVTGVMIISDDVPPSFVEWVTY